MIRSYYDGVFAGKVVSWDMDLRRLPNISPAAEVLRVKGDSRLDLPRGTRICWIEVNDGNRQRNIPVTLVMKPVERVPVAAVDIDARTPITPDLIQWQDQPTAKFGAIHICTMSDLNGSWAKVRIPAGTILTSRRVGEMPLVTIGQPVKVVIRVGRIEATVEGKALEDGRRGARVRVLNTASGAKLRGIVEPNGSVLIDG